MTSLVPAPCGVSRRKVNAKLAKISEMTIEYAEKHIRYKYSFTSEVAEEII